MTQASCRPRRIVVVSAAPPTNSGGLQISTGYIARALFEAGCDVTLIAPGLHEKDVRLAPDGVKHLEVPRGRFFYPRVASAVRRRFHETLALGVDAVVSESAGGFPILGTCRRRGIPFVFHAHGTALRDEGAARSSLHRLYRRAFVWLDMRLLPRVSAIVAVSSVIADELRHFLGHRAPAIIRYLPNAVPTGTFRPDRLAREEALRRWPISDGAKVVLFVGRLVEAKRADLVLSAVAHLRHRVESPIAVWIVGEGPTRSDLESLGAHLGLRECLTFLGRLAPDAVRCALNASHVLVLPSDRREGMPYVIIEAQAVGLPIVVSDTLDVGRNDLTEFRSGDVESLAGALQRALELPVPDEAAIALVSAEYSLGVQARKLLAVIDELRKP